MGRDSHEYYGSSVTLGLTTFRQSRIPVKLNVLVHVGPACPQTRSLRATHHRERYYCFPPQQCIVVSPVTSRLRWAYCCTVSDIGLAFAFATGSALSFSICTGLAGTTTLPSFTLPRFWSCYRPPGSFLPEVRPSALKGQLLPTFPYSIGIQLAVRRRTRNRYPPYSYRQDGQAQLLMPLSLGQWLSGLRGLSICFSLCVFALACWLPA